MPVARFRDQMLDVFFHEKIQIYLLCTLVTFSGSCVKTELKFNQ